MISDAPPQIHPVQTGQRFILTQLGRLTLVFPSVMVASVLVIERSQILALPFYEPAILGCIHNVGQIVPLVSMHQIVGTKAGLTKESLTVMRLANVVETLAGVGLVVDRVLGSSSQDQLPPELFSTAQEGYELINTDNRNWLFRPEFLSDRLWQPQRYASL